MGIFFLERKEILWSESTLDFKTIQYKYKQMTTKQIMKAWQFS